MTDRAATGHLLLAERAQPSCAIPLSRREREISCLVAEGHTNAAIARSLFLSTRTVEAHLDHVRIKLGFHGRAQIAAYIARAGSVDWHAQGTSN